ncbi:hypothetical protein SMICM17S_03898 [Streptomyces microflavus]
MGAVCPGRDPGLLALRGNLRLHRVLLLGLRRLLGRELLCGLVGGGGRGGSRCGVLRVRGGDGLRSRGDHGLRRGSGGSLRSGRGDGLGGRLGLGLGRLRVAPRALGGRHQQKVVVLGCVLGGVEEGVRARGGDARLLHHACVLRLSLARDLAGVSHAYPSPIVSAPSAHRPGRRTTARRCSSSRTSGLAARHETPADLFLFSRPFAAAAGSSATARCGLRHVARPPVGAVPQSGTKQSTFPDIDERSDERPGAVQQSASLPPVPDRKVRGRGPNVVRREGTRRTVRARSTPRCPGRRTGAASTRRCSRCR